MRENNAEHEKNEAVAFININEAKNSSSNFRLEGLQSARNAVDSDSISYVPRVYGLMCVKPHILRTSRVFEFGERQPGDYLLRFRRKKKMESNSSLPRHTFHYYDRNVIVSHAKIKLNVSYCDCAHLMCRE